MRSWSRESWFKTFKPFKPFKTFERFELFKRLEPPSEVRPIHFAAEGLRLALPVDRNCGIRDELERARPEDDGL